MSMKHWNLVPRSLAVLGLLFGVSLAAPSASLAGQEAVKLHPAEDRDVPEGSQIPAHRIQATEEKAQEYKARLKAKQLQQQQESLPEKESSKPEGEPQ